MPINYEFATQTQQCRLLLKYMHTCSLEDERGLLCLQDCGGSVPVFFPLFWSDDLGKNVEIVCCLGGSFRFALHA